jgi:uncharacterized protein
MPTVSRVLFTERAAELIDRLRTEHGPLMFHQSGGCCDGSQPMCFAEGDFLIGANDVRVDTVYNCPFYMAGDQFAYWEHTQLTLDVTEGRGSSFSLEIPLGLRFVIKSRVFTDEEMENLIPVLRGEELE